MANKVVSQFQEDEKELEELRKAYEDKKKEVANKKRSYTRLVNQTEDRRNFPLELEKPWHIARCAKENQLHFRQDRHDTSAA